MPKPDAKDRDPDVFAVVPSLGRAPASGGAHALSSGPPTPRTGACPRPISGLGPRNARPSMRTPPCLHGKRRIFTCPRATCPSGRPQSWRIQAASVGREGKCVGFMGATRIAPAKILAAAPHRQAAPSSQKCTVPRLAPCTKSPHASVLAGRVVRAGSGRGPPEGPAAVNQLHLGGFLHHGTAAALPDSRAGPAPRQAWGAPGCRQQQFQARSTKIPCLAAPRKGPQVLGKRA